MCRKFLIICFVLFYNFGYAQDNLLNEDMLVGIYQINFTGLNQEDKPITIYGTGFVINYKERQYLITARHLFDPFRKMKDSTTYRAVYSLTASGVSDKLFGEFFFTKTIDVAVARIVYRFEIPALHNKYVAKFTGVQQGNYAIFNGFPMVVLSDRTYQLCTDIGSGICYPFTKIGRISGLSRNINTDNTYFVDAMNSTGFSGSPLFVYDSHSKKFVLGGVVHSYLNQEVTKVGEDGNSHQWTGVSGNSGLTKAANITFAYNLIYKIENK